MTIPDRIKELAKQRGMTVKDISQKTGIAQNTFIRWNHRQSPMVSTLALVAKALDVTVSELIAGTDEDNPE